MCTDALSLASTEARMLPGRMAGLTASVLTWGLLLCKSCSVFLLVHGREAFM